MRELLNGSLLLVDRIKASTCVGIRKCQVADIWFLKIKKKQIIKQLQCILVTNQPLLIEQTAIQALVLHQQLCLYDIVVGTQKCIQVVFHLPQAFITVNMQLQAWSLKKVVTCAQCASNHLLETPWFLPMLSASLWSPLVSTQARKYITSLGG